MVAEISVVRKVSLFLLKSTISSLNHKLSFKIEFCWRFFQIENTGVLAQSTLCDVTEGSHDFHTL